MTAALGGCSSLHCLPSHNGRLHESGNSRRASHPLFLKEIEACGPSRPCISWRALRERSYFGVRVNCFGVQVNPGLRRESRRAGAKEDRSQAPCKTGAQSNVDGLLPGAIWVSKNGIERDAKAPDVANSNEHDHTGRE